MCATILVSLQAFMELLLDSQHGLTVLCGARSMMSDDEYDACVSWVLIVCLCCIMCPDDLCSLLNVNVT